MYLGCTDNSNCDFASTAELAGRSSSTRWGRARPAPTADQLAAVAGRAGSGAPFGQYKIELPEGQESDGAAAVELAIGIRPSFTLADPSLSHVR